MCAHHLHGGCAEWLRTDFAIDADELPDEAALALFWAVASEDDTANLAAATRNAYEFNWDSLSVEDARTQNHRDVLAALLGVRVALQNALAEIFAAEESTLAGDYVSVTCDETGSCTPSALDKGRYELLAKQGDGLTEPHSGDGDIDANDISKADECENVLARVGSPAAFVAAAQNPLDTGMGGVAEVEGEVEGKPEGTSCFVGPRHATPDWGGALSLGLLLLVLTRAANSRARRR